MYNTYFRAATGTLKGVLNQHQRLRGRRRRLRRRRLRRHLRGNRITSAVAAAHVCASSESAMLVLFAYITIYFPLWATMRVRVHYVAQPQPMTHSLPERYLIRNLVPVPSPRRSCRRVSYIVRGSLTACSQSYRLGSLPRTV